MAASNLKIQDYHYVSHHSPGELVTFTITIRNNENVLQTGYALFALTLHGTNTAIENYTGAGAMAANGGITTLSTTWTAVEGLYTVTVKVYDSLDRVSDTIYAPLAVEVGSTTDYVAAFPNMLDLGSIQYGRYMHPMPLEITWSHYSRSFLRNAYPWYMRIYTDNQHRYKGIEGAIYKGRVATQGGGGSTAFGSPAGLVSDDGKYVLPIKVWCLNYGPDVEEGWDANLLGPPPVKEDYYWKGPLLDSEKRDSTRVTWEWVPDYIDMTTDSSTWRKLIGRDPYDTHYASDSNQTGDFTLSSPFRVFIAYEASTTTVEGRYTADLVIEMYTP